MFSDDMYTDDEINPFNRDISKWNVSNATDMNCMFRNSALEKSGNLPAWFKNSRWNNENKN